MLILEVRNPSCDLTGAGKRVLPLLPPIKIYLPERILTELGASKLLEAGEMEILRLSTRTFRVEYLVPQLAAQLPTGGYTHTIPLVHTRSDLNLMCSLASSLLCHY